MAQRAMPTIPLNTYRGIAPNLRCPCGTFCGAWPDRVVEPEGVIKCLTVRNLICACICGHEHKCDDVRGQGFFAQTRRERRAYPTVDLEGASNEVWAKKSCRPAVKFL